MSGLSTRSYRYPIPYRARARLLVVAVAATMLVSVLGVASAAAQSQPGNGQGPPVINPQARAADVARPAVVWVRVHYDAWVTTHYPETIVPPNIPVQVDFGCTGFIVNPAGYVVTAGHCLDDGIDGARGSAIQQVINGLVDAGIVSYLDRDQLFKDVAVGNVRWRVEGNIADTPPDRKVSVAVGAGNVRWRSNVKANGAVSARVEDFLKFDQGDVGLLKIEKTGLPSIKLLPSNDIQVGDELLSIGYPATGAEAVEDGEPFGLTNRNGQINAERPKGPSNLTFYETSATLTPGMSGGPTVNLDGDVVGLASFTDEDANFIVPSSIIQELLSRNGARNELGQLDNLYRQGLDNYYRHEYSAAISDFDQVLALMPQHKQAQEKKSKAAELRERFGDPAPAAPATKPGRWTPRLLIGAAVALVLLIVLVGLALRMRTRRRRQRQLAPPAGSGHMDGAAQGYDLKAPELLDDGDLALDDAPVRRSGARPGLSRSDPYEAHAGDGAAAAGSVSVRTAGDPNGRPVDAAASAATLRRFCFNCGASVQPDDPTCHRCGTRLG
jgi:serine protease Do